MTKSMARIRALRPEFVETIPETLDPGVLYISVRYATASHLCACGCGQGVVTPIRPTDWSLTWNGESVALRPSIGNWALPCRSHYWVREGGRIEWAPAWSKKMVREAGRAVIAEKRTYFAKKPRGGSRTR